MLNNRLGELDPNGIDSFVNRRITKVLTHDLLQDFLGWIRNTDINQVSHINLRAPIYTRDRYLFFLLRFRDF
jgi:hypothetical protein